MANNFKIYWHAEHEIQIQFGPMTKYKMPLNPYFTFTKRRWCLSWSRKTWKFYFTDYKHLHA